MKVKIGQLLEGASQANGLTVIIDVFRAFSTACYAFANGAERIYPVGDINQAYQMKSEHPEYILMGERFEKKPEGFDFGNSPTHIRETDLHGKTLVHTTSSGTQGITAAVNADEIITGSFVNASAIVNYIRQQAPKQVSLVCMGYSCEYPTDEDTFLAEYIANELEGRENNFQEMVEKLRTGSGARFFEAENQEWSPSSDFDYCLTLNQFPFVLRVERENGLNCLHKIDLD